MSTSRAEHANPAVCSQKRAALNRYKQYRQASLVAQVVKNPPCNARDTQFNPWSQKAPRVLEQLILCTTTTEPVL